MPKLKRAGSDDSRRCSFCHKSQGVVGKLISSPSDYPRVYICDQCVAVCNSILEDCRPEAPSSPQSEGQTLRQHLANLLEDIPDSDLPAAGKILRALGDRGGRALNENPGDIAPISAAGDRPDPRTDTGAR